MLKILQGIPGPSKTKFITNKTRTGEWPMYAMICAESQYSEEQKPEVQSLIELPALNLSPKNMCFRRVVKLIINKAPFVIVDNCNYDPVDIAPYIRLAEAFQHAYEVIFVDPGDDYDARFQKELVSLRNYSWPSHWNRKVVTLG